MGLWWSNQVRQPPSSDCPTCRCPKEPNKLNPWRPRWANTLDFTMTGISYVAGVQAMLTFPYLMATGGGAAFLVPYIIFTLLIGFPTLFLDISLGQFTSKGLLSCWECVPIFRGLGIAKLLVSVLFSVHFAVMLGWYANYFAVSFMSPLPWVECKPEWTADYSETVCGDLVTDMTPEQCIALRLMVTPTGVCTSGDVIVATWNRSVAMENNLVTSAAYGYFSSKVVGSSWVDGLGDLGGLRWQLVVATLVCWVLVFLVLMLGIRSYGKVAYVTTIVGVILQLVLTFKALSLDGAKEGVRELLTPDWDVLVDKPKVWVTAFNQAVFSLNFGLGGWGTLSSYNRFHRIYIWDCLVVIVVNLVWSFLGALTVFGFLSFSAADQGLDVRDVLETKGASLALIEFPEIAVRLDNPQAWSSIFYLLLFILGIGTQFTIVENLCTAFADIFHQFHRANRRPLLVALVCGLLFALGLILCTDSGVYGVVLLHEYISARNLSIIMSFKFTIVCYMYGFEKFNEDITCMIGKWNIFKYWSKVSWYFVCPGTLLVFLVWWLVLYILDYRDEQFLNYTYPAGWTALGWVIALFPVGVMLMFVVVLFCRRYLRGEIKLPLTKPTEKWGPDLEEHRKYNPRYHNHSPGGATSCSRMNMTGGKCGLGSKGTVVSVVYDGNQPPPPQPQTCRCRRPQFEHRPQVIEPRPQVIEPPTPGGTVIDVRQDFSMMPPEPIMPLPCQTLEPMVPDMGSTMYVEGIVQQPITHIPYVEPEMVVPAPIYFSGLDAGPSFDDNPYDPHSGGHTSSIYVSNSSTEHVGTGHLPHYSGRPTPRFSDVTVVHPPAHEVGVVGSPQPLDGLGYNTGVSEVTVSSATSSLQKPLRSILKNGGSFRGSRHSSQASLVPNEVYPGGSGGVNNVSVVNVN